MKIRALFLSEKANFNEKFLEIKYIFCIYKTNGITNNMLSMRVKPIFVRGGCWESFCFDQRRQIRLAAAS